MNFLKDLRNNMDFPLRQFFRWRRRGLKLVNEDKSGLFDQCAEGESADSLREDLESRYPLDLIKNRTTRRKYRENLYYLDLVDRALHTLNIKLPDSVIAADVGVADWFYAGALAAALLGNKHKKREISLEGFEIDPYRVYLDFYSRADYAKAYIENLTGVRFIETGFTPHPNRYDSIFQFFPFLLVENHLDWGLPGKLHKPQQLLNGIVNSLKPGGMLLIVNQGEQERDYQHNMINRSEFRKLESYLHESPLFAYGVSRYVTVGEKG